MRALTVQQPWAWAIIHGGKDVENRTQAWSYRGPLVIHAGQTKDDTACRRSTHLAASVLADVITNPRPNRDIRGAFIGLVDLVDVHHHIGSGERNDCCDSPWAEPWHPGAGRLVHLVLRDPQPLDRPIPCRGRLGLWTPPADILDELRGAA